MGGAPHEASSSNADIRGLHVLDSGGRVTVSPQDRTREGLVRAESPYFTTPRDNGVSCIDKAVVFKRASPSEPHRPNELTVLIGTPIEGCGRLTRLRR